MTILLLSLNICARAPLLKDNVGVRQQGEEDCAGVGVLSAVL
jgi:hypothetical protein